jgi:hypothetical protein
LDGLGIARRAQDGGAPVPRFVLGVRGIPAQARERGRGAVEDFATLADRPIDRGRNLRQRGGRGTARLQFRCVAAADPADGRVGSRERDADVTQFLGAERSATRGAFDGSEKAESLAIRRISNVAACSSRTTAKSECGTSASAAAVPRSVIVCRARTSRTAKKSSTARLRSSASSRMACAGRGSGTGSHHSINACDTTLVAPLAEDQACVS